MHHVQWPYQVFSIDISEALQRKYWYSNGSVKKCHGCIFIVNITKTVYHLHCFEYATVQVTCTITIPKI